MENLDLRYLCTVIGNLSGIPIRIFDGETECFYFSMVNLPADPAVLCRQALFAIEGHVGYFMTADFHCYGLVRKAQTRIILGPTRQISESEAELRALVFALGLSGEAGKQLSDGMRVIGRMPIESVLQILCTMNYVLNGEKLELKDIQGYDAKQEKLLDIQGRYQAEHALTAPDPPLQTEHNTMDLENTLLRMVRKGDTAALSAWFQNAPAIRSGVVAHDPLRQQKNLFVVTITLVSRAAIRGGMQVEDALTLSDSYLRQCELLTTPEKITSLQYRMLLDYTERVDRLRRGGNPSKLLLDVANYVQHHISEPIRVEDIAVSLYLSRPYLSKKFKAEAGMSLTDFILQEKIEESKRLLRYSDRSVASIGTYLSFSSPSHFSRTFRKYSGMLLKEYREIYVG